MQLSHTEIEVRAERAAALFAQGFNCSQAVVAACADLYDWDEKTALRAAASFGGGIGRMRMTCGAACGMFMLAGLENGNTLPDQPRRKMPNYQLVQRLAERFKQENGGIVCADLLGLNGAPAQQKKPCAEMVKGAVREFLEEIKSSETKENNNS